MAVELRRPWLAAAWPGMGGVAQIAGSYLATTLRAQPVAELDGRPFFEAQSISVKSGLVQPTTIPRTVFHGWRNPDGGRDLLILLGEQQPPHGGSRYAQALIEIAESYAVERVVTFAAMATPIHPSSAPRVFGVATSAALLNELRGSDVTPLEEGEISGLNGTFIAAASARHIPAVCLMGEFPFYAAPLPNPKASAAVLRVFSKLCGVSVDLAPIGIEAERIERSLVEHLENLERAARSAAQGGVSGGEPDAEGEGEGEGESAAEAEAPPPKPAEPVLAPEARERIEALFAQARHDRAKALELKAELDRHGLFKKYEDRFLDLFKHAG